MGLIIIIITFSGSIWWCGRTYIALIGGPVKPLHQLRPVRFARRVISRGRS